MPEPLFSIYLLTYNQESMVIDALDSTLEQGYAPVELIISDDCSEDNTVAVIKKWISTHREQFDRIELITNPTNLGIVGNRKKALAACSGEYVKGVGGDDILGKKCLKFAAEYFQENPNSIYLHGKTYFFNTLNQDGTPHVLESREKTRFFDLPSLRQYDELMFRNQVFAFAVFFRRSFFSMINTDHFQFKHLEDWPAWLVATSMGYPIRYTDSVVVYYRVHEGSVQRSTDSSGKASQQTLAYFEDCINFHKKFSLPYLRSQHRYLRYVYNKKILERYVWAFSNKKTLRNFPLYKLYKKITTPLHLLSFAKNKIKKMCDKNS